jgi:hypothetical protein
MTPHCTLSTVSNVNLGLRHKWMFEIRFQGAKFGRHLIVQSDIDASGVAKQMVYQTCTYMMRGRRVLKSNRP